MTKPTVKYLSFASVEEGLGTYVRIKSHPNINKGREYLRWVKTSTVIRILKHSLDGPTFETENTIYAPGAA